MHAPTICMFIYVVMMISSSMGLSFRREKNIICRATRMSITLNIVGREATITTIAK